MRISNDVILNDLKSGSARAVLNQSTVPVSFTGNDVFGLTVSQIATRPVTASGTTFLTSEPTLYTTHPWQIGTVPPDRLVFYLAEDAGTGNAQFIVDVDGKALGAAQTVTASQQGGRAEVLSFAATFGPGSHSIAIDFVSDNFSGAGAATRHLHVDGIDNDGQHYAAETAAPLKGSSATFTVGGANARAIATSDPTGHSGG